MDRLAAMEAYVKVVDTGSFSAAARQLEIGQPAVSKAISQLEKWLGVRLLMRTTRSLTATESGLEFYKHACKAVEEASDAAAAARGAATTLTGRLKVSTSVCFGRIHIMPHLSKFLTDHPDLDIDLILDDRNIDLVEEGVDVAFRSGSLVDSSLTARKLGQARRFVMATPSYLAKHGVPRRPEDIVNHQTVIYTRDGGGLSWTFTRGGEDVTISASGRVRVSAAEGLREAVFGGIGLAVSSEWIFTPELVSGAVVPILSDWKLPTMDLWAVSPAGRLLSAKARAFSSFVQSGLARSQENVIRTLAA